MSEKLVFSGKTHNTNGRDGATRSSDGRLDIKLPEPHPAAEQLFGAAWSACYMGAIELAAARRKVKLAGRPGGRRRDRSVSENGAFFLRARLAVSVPGVEPRAGAGSDRYRAHDLPVLQGRPRQHRRDDGAPLRRASSELAPSRLAGTVLASLGISHAGPLRPKENAP